MAPGSTTILFIPGAWHSGQAFAPTANLLQQAGYNTELIDLPSVGPPKHLSSFEPDVEVIRTHIAKAVTAGQDVVLFAHSYGGIPACEAAKDFATLSSDSGQKGRITHLFFCSSFLIPENASLIAAFGGNDLPWFMITPDRLEVLPENPAVVFYNDLPPEEAEKQAAAIVPQSYQVMHSPLTYAAWRYIPSTYLYCARDNAIPPEIQRMMVEGTAQGVAIRTEEVDAGHSPFISKPKEVAEAVERSIRSGE